MYMMPGYMYMIYDIYPTKDNYILSSSHEMWHTFTFLKGEGGECKSVTEINAYINVLWALSWSYVHYKQRVWAGVPIG